MLIIKIILCARWKGQQRPSYGSLKALQSSPMEMEKRFFLRARFYEPINNNNNENWHEDNPSQCQQCLQSICRPKTIFPKISVACCQLTFFVQVRLRRDETLLLPAGDHTYRSSFNLFFSLWRPTFLLLKQMLLRWRPAWSIWKPLFFFQPLFTFFLNFQPIGGLPHSLLCNGPQEQDAAQKQPTMNESK